MSHIQGENLLREYANTAFPDGIVSIGKRIHFMGGFGHSNSIAIEGDTSFILIDALDSDVRAKKLKDALKEISDKPVRTIIFTHGHPDHRGGSGAFRDTAEEVICFSSRRPVLKYYDRLNDVLNKRTVRQFGFRLSDDELITQGLGIREGHTCGEGKYNFLAPTTIYEDDIVDRIIDGVHINLVSAVGETDDQLFVWLPEEKVLCCGDTYYGCWPNLYAIRGSQYRDIAAWTDSLLRIMEYPAEVLLPGHTKPIFGHDAILDVLGNYRDAIEYVLTETIDCMNKGMSESETVEHVKLPETYANKSYLGEFYGTVAWSVRAIYQGYLGWFDGNPVNLAPLPDQEYAKSLMKLIGSPEKVVEEIRSSLDCKQFQMALQLCDLLKHAGTCVSEADCLRKEALLSIAKTVTSANARHYYMACAKE